MNTKQATRYFTSTSGGDAPKPARNEPCFCGSGKKFKKCHLLLDHERARQEELAAAERRRQRDEAERAERERRFHEYAREAKGRGGHAARMALLALAVGGRP